MKELRMAIDMSVRKGNDAVQAAQKHVLEMIATGCPLDEVLEAICRLVEEQQPGLLCSILIADERRQQIAEAVGSSLPASYLQDAIGVSTAPPYAGSCAEALDTGKPVHVADLEKDEQFPAEWRATLLGYGLRSCCSVPVTGQDGMVLASFAFYRPEPCDCATVNEEWLAAATHLARIAIERKQAEDRLRQSEGRLRLILESAKDYAIITTDAAGLITGWNTGAKNLFGYAKEEMMGRPVAIVFIPEDQAMAVSEQELEAARATGVAEDERWHVRKDGTRFWASGLVQPLRDGDHVLGFIKIMRDMTEARLAKDRLETSEERFRSLVIATTQIVWRCNVHGQVDEDCPSWRAFTGQKAEDIQGLGWLVSIHPDDRERTAAAWQVSVRTGIPFMGDYRLQRHDGEYRLVLTRGIPVTDPDGAVREWVGTCTDITEQRQAEDALRFQLQLTKGITDNATTAIFMMDVHGHCSFANPAAEQMTGFTFEELKGGPLHDIIHHSRPDGAPYPISECPIDRAFRGNYDVRGHEDMFIRKNGEFFPVLVNARVIEQWGKTVGTVIEVRDITAEKAAAEALRRQTARATRLLESNVIGVIFATMERITEANDAFLQMVGYSREDLEAGRLSWREMTPPEWVDADEQGYRELVEQGVCTPFRKEYFRKDGTRVHIILGAAMIDREPLNWVCFIQDITRVKVVEDELRDADRRKDEFLAILAHELRNPLAPIRNAVQLLRVKGPPVPELIWCRDVIDRQVDQMARLLDDLLDVSRITRNKLELRKERVTLASVLDSAVEVSRPLIEGGGHTLSRLLPPVPVYLNADLVRLTQVFANLLNNAAKYTARGGHIELTGEVVGEEVIVAVKDNGTGIAPALQPRLFEMFSQAASALERSQGGLGIGLSLVKGLTEMHGGTVTAHSDGPGTGSTFVVRLPVMAGGQAQEPPAAAEPPAMVKCRILLADDNLDAADSLAMVLRLLGCEVRTAADGRKAVEAAEAFRPEVVLLDIGMPELNGYEAAKLIREQPWGREIVLVALTGWGQEEDKRLAREAGFDHHLVKPAELGEVQHILAQRKRRRS
jgi:PAS domain S-box-containing protein